MTSYIRAGGQGQGRSARLIMETYLWTSLTTMLGEVVWKGLAGVEDILGAEETKLELAARRERRKRCCDILGKGGGGIKLAAGGKGPTSYVQLPKEGAAAGCAMGKPGLAAGW